MLRVVQGVQEPRRNMGKEIIKIETDISPLSVEDNIMQVIESRNWDFPTMTPDKISAISERMVEMDRALQTTGRKNTQHTNQLMTLTMLTDSPYRRLRQCLVQIDKSRHAVEDAYWSDLRNQIKIKEWSEKDTEEGRLEIAQYHYSRDRTKIFVEGALKEIAIFQEAYEEIRKANNIPADWDEEDAELDEIRHHLRQAFRQAHRDMTLTGSITQGNAEYLEQYGVHLQTARSVISKYIAHCEQQLEEGNVPNINSLYEFLDSVVEIFGDEFHHVLKHIGLDGIIRQDYLYRSQRDLGDIGKAKGKK